MIDGEAFNAGYNIGFEAGYDQARMDFKACAEEVKKENLCISCASKDCKLRDDGQIITSCLYFLKEK